MFLGKKRFTKEERQLLIDHVNDVVAAAIAVRKELLCALPEYIYKEAFAAAAAAAKIPILQEYEFHPTFKGKTMQSSMRMDFVIPREDGDIIVETKALKELTDYERQQLFSYMLTTGMPYGLLINFAPYPFPEIERYHFDAGIMKLTEF